MVLAAIDVGNRRACRPRQVPSSVTAPVAVPEMVAASLRAGDGDVDGLGVGAVEGVDRQGVVHDRGRRSSACTLAAALLSV